ncbi:MAG: helix-turn-helix domain-containing protein [Caulobacter sp.]|nr:helix-turn-helix domain-containing protein [Caulobacter sp.]
MTDEALQSEKFPRRTQRRQQTRARIVSAADKLFRTVGYGAATMSAIADEADVHVTTLFTHFKTKLDLAVSMNEQAATILEQMVAEAKGAKPVFDFFLDLVLLTARRVETARDPDNSLWRQLSRDPELTFAWVQYEQRQIELLADYIAHDYALDPATDYRPDLIANLLLSSSRLSHRRWTDSAKPMDLVTETRKAVELAIAMARPVLAAG